MNNWQEKKLGDFLTQKKREVIINPNTEYSLVTISNKGIIRLRKKKRGAEIAAKKAYLAKAGDFIYSRLAAHTGAFGIVGEELDNALVTGEMPCFEIDKRQALPEILTNMLNTPGVIWQLKQFTKGMGRVRIKENMMLSLSLLLPDVSEQKKLSKNIQAFKHELAQLGDEFLNQRELLAGLRRRVLQEHTKDIAVDEVKLGDFMQHRKSFFEIEDGKTYKRCRVQLHRRGVMLRDNILGAKIKTKKQRLCKANDFIVAEMDAKLGGYGIIPNELEGAIVSSHYYLYEVNTKKMMRDFFRAMIDLGMLQEQIKARGSTNYARVSPQEVLEYKVFCPPLDEQKKAVKKIALCNALEEQVRNNEALAKRLIQAALKEAFTPPQG